MDLNHDITYSGFYETVDTKGGITIPVIELCLYYISKCMRNRIFRKINFQTVSI